MSSGQPYKKPSDVQMYRNEYLNDLEMRKDLDKINLEANTNYIKTGALPPQSQMSDTRSPSDKLLDLVYVKKQIIDALTPLSTAVYASNVVEGLLSNPNNVDNKLLVFAAQRSSEIVDQLKKIYKIGIRGDLQDAQKLVTFIIKLYRTQRGAMLSLKEMQNRFTNDKKTSASLLGSLHNIILNVITYIEYVDRFMQGRGYYRTELNNLKTLLNYIPNFSGEFRALGRKCDFKQLEQIILNGIPNSPNSMGFQNLAIKYMTFLNSDFPSLDELNYLLSNIVRSFEAYKEQKNGSNIEKIKDAINKLYNILYNGDVEQRLNEFRGDPLLEGFVQELSPENAEFITTNVNQLSELGYDNSNFPNAFSEFMNPSASEESKTSPYDSGISQDTPQTSSPDLIVTPHNLIPHNPLPEGWNPPEGVTINNAIKSYKLGLRRIQISSDPEIFNRVNNTFIQNYNYDFNLFDKWYNDNNIGGNGLFKKKRGRPRGCGVAKPYKQTISENLNTDKGLEESRRFVKFGKYLINTNKLNDNILSLKIPSGGVVVGHPTIKITSNFKKIVKNMIDNVNPSFKDLQSLSDTEKNYLYTISKKANILDKFSIPTPDMSEDDKDINEYEILKGEIMAGNDNKDLIKKFKAKIIKMSNSGLLNKKEVSSILHDLLSLNL